MGNKSIQFVSHSYRKYKLVSKKIGSLKNAVITVNDIRKLKYNYLN